MRVETVKIPKLLHTPASNFLNVIIFFAALLARHVRIQVWRQRIIEEMGHHRSSLFVNKSLNTCCPPFDGVVIHLRDVSLIDFLFNFAQRV